jgi:hypothetical protein
MTELGEEQVAERPAQPPTEEEEVDLVALLSAVPENVRYPLRTLGVDGQWEDSPRFYIEARMMTGAEHERYLNTGMQYRVPTGGGAAPREATFSTNTEAQTKMLLELCLTDFLIPIGKKEERMSGRTSVWPAFSRVPTPMLEWTKKKLRSLNGLEVAAPAGEA